MLKEIRKIKSINKQKYYRYMQTKGFIGKYINDNGYVCYDPDELKKYKKTHRRGRPAKR